MLNDNLFVTFDPVKQPNIELPNLPTFDSQFFNPYSDFNLNIGKGQTSFDGNRSITNILDKFTIQNRTTQDTTVPSSVTSNSVSYNTRDTRAYVKNWLMKNHGLTNDQASALAGVWYAESRLNPSIHEIGKENNPFAGKGIAQWTGRQRQKHAEDIYKQLYGKSKEIKKMTLDEQLNVAISEFKERTGNWNRFINSKNIDEATDIVWRGYENGGNNALATMQQMNQVYKSRTQKQWNERIRFANEIKNM